MANLRQVDILSDGVDVWNEWRDDNPQTRPDLQGVDLSEEELNEANLCNANLSGADFNGTNLTDADLTDAIAVNVDFGSSILNFANLTRANLTRSDFREAKLDGANLALSNLEGAKLHSASLIGADLRDATLMKSDLTRANLHGADLRGANLKRAQLTRANLTGAFLSNANLFEANLHAAQLIDTALNNAILTGCRVFGVSAWGVDLSGTDQRNLIITPHDQQTITVDDLEIAQFVYLLLSNQKIRNLIDTIGKKAVLILGRFSSERKVVLDALKEALRSRDYVPMLFDFEGPRNRDISETVATLAHMARFIIADITNARSIPQELMMIVPNLPSVPVQPLILASDQEYGMFEHFRRFPWVLEPYIYNDLKELLRSLDKSVISPAEEKVKEQVRRK